MKNHWWRFAWCRSCGSLTLATREREICPTCFMRTILKNKKDGRIKCCLICGEVDERVCSQCFQKKGQSFPELRDPTSEEIRQRLNSLDFQYGVSFVARDNHRIRWGTFRPFNESLENYLWEVQGIFPNAEIRMAIQHPVSFSPHLFVEIVADLKGGER